MKHVIKAVVIKRASGMTIRAFRKNAGLPQEGLAVLSGIDRGYMGRLDRGEFAPCLDTIFKLLRPLNITFVAFATEMEANIRLVKQEAPAEKAVGRKKRATPPVAVSMTSESAAQPEAPPGDPD